ncbi:MAG: type 1 pili tip component [Pseudomonadota bacterium]|nr:type 1 pili tip component [Pseudomonadota bacterium]
MDVKALLEQWEKAGHTRLTATEYPVRLPVHDAARIAALAQMYNLDLETVITDLLAAALTEVEASFPYVQGSRVIAEDDHGDPIYEDIGPTPRYLDLVKEHAARLEQDIDEE